MHKVRAAAHYSLEVACTHESNPTTNQDCKNRSPKLPSYICIEPSAHQGRKQEYIQKQEQTAALCITLTYRILQDCKDMTMLQQHFSRKKLDLCAVVMTLKFVDARNSAVLHTGVASQHCCCSCLWLLTPNVFAMLKSLQRYASPAALPFQHTETHNPTAMFLLLLLCQ